MAVLNIRRWSKSQRLFGMIGDKLRGPMLGLSHEPDLGYLFHSHETLDHPGHPRLDVIIPATPTYEHFDPQKAQFYIVSPEGDIEHLSIHHPWTMEKRYRVCAGRIVLTDRKAKRVEAFSFGGDLQILSDEDHTVCALVSAVPIFPLFTTHDLSMWIVAEFEILLAQQKAHLDPQHPHDFQTHLAAVDPFLLYASCLQALQDKANHIHTGAVEFDRQGAQFVQTEVKRLQEKGEWPLLVPALDDLF